MSYLFKDLSPSEIKLFIRIYSRPDLLSKQCVADALKDTDFPLQGHDGAFLVGQIRAWINRKLKYYDCSNRLHLKPDYKSSGLDWRLVDSYMDGLHNARAGSQSQWKK